jgi:hypothetical protein
MRGRLQRLNTIAALLDFVDNDPQGYPRRDFGATCAPVG